MVLARTLVVRNGSGHVGDGMRRRHGGIVVVVAAKQAVAAIHRNSGIARE